MLKKVVYLLIVAFTLQLSWGVASAYCLHETGRAVKHFGHHQHEHESAGADGAKTVAVDEHQSPAAKKLVADPDCASCTHSPLAAYTWQIELVQPLLPAYQPISPPFELPAPYLGLPERPQWIIAA